MQQVTVGLLNENASFRGDIMEKLMKISGKYGLEMNISTFRTLEELDRYELAFDLLLMDTDYSGKMKDGIEWILTQQYTGLYQYLIYVTEHEERVFDAVLTDPIAFVRKSNLDADLKEAIDRFHYKITSLPPFVIVPEGRRRYVVFPNDVMYFFSCGHYIEVTSPTGEIKVIRSKLAELEKLFCGYGFLRIHTRYLVNLRYIEYFERKKVVFSNRTSCYVSDKFKEQTHERLGMYKYEQANDEGAV